MDKIVNDASNELQKAMSELTNKNGGVSKVEIDNNGKPTSVTPPPPASVPKSSPAPKVSSAATGPSDLDDIKQNAVAMLKPLIGALDISAEEKFEALIEIIRASDDQEMIPQAFESAQAIEDNDRRAQALIDIINEINYINKIKG